MGKRSIITTKKLMCSDNTRQKFNWSCNDLLIKINQKHYDTLYSLKMSLFNIFFTGPIYLKAFCLFFNHIYMNIQLKL